MKIDAIDSVLLAVADLDAACRPYERLGLRLSPARNVRRTLRVGGAANLFAVHFRAAAGADGLLAQPLSQALAAGRSLFAVGLGVADLGAAVRHLMAKDVQAIPFRDGDRELAWLALHDQAGTDLVLAGQDGRAAAGGPAPPGHSFPLRRLDHFAVITHDLEVKSRFWAEVLGVAVAGEVTTPVLVIHSLRLGDAVLGQRGMVILGMATLEQAGGGAGWHDR
jgi:catechol 2,3-dioxygenase-like lactoylglutathione lyase family enzyme